MTQIIRTILTLLLVGSLSLPSAVGNDSYKKRKIIDTQDVVVYSDSDSAIFINAFYDKKEDNLDFTTLSTISVIQIFDSEGNMEFQLPVMSNRVKINKNIFGDGQFTLGFMLEGQTTLHMAEVHIK